MTTMLDRPETVTVSDDTAFDGIIQSVKGDILVGWHADNASEIAEAEAAFNTLVKEQGALAYKAGETGLDAGTQIKDFDATAEQVVVVARLVGG